MQVKDLGKARHAFHGAVGSAFCISVCCGAVLSAFNAKAGITLANLFAHFCPFLPSARNPGNPKKAKKGKKRRRTKDNLGSTCHAFMQLCNNTARCLLEHARYECVY